MTLPPMTKAHRAAAGIPMESHFYCFIHPLPGRVMSDCHFVVQLDHVIPGTVPYRIQ